MLSAIALSEESEINGKCYHSEKKNEPPHQFKVRRYIFSHPYLHYLTSIISDQGLVVYIK